MKLYKSIFILLGCKLPKGKIRCSSFNLRLTSLLQKFALDFDGLWSGSMEPIMGIIKHLPFRADVGTTEIKIWQVQNKPFSFTFDKRKDFHFLAFFCISN